MKKNGEKGRLRKKWEENGGRTGVTGKEWRGENK